MKILLAFFIFLILLTGLEIYSIYELGNFLGSIWNALAVILITGIIGAVIARKNAKDALATLTKGDFSSSPPARQIFDTIAFFFAAALLILPGLITDIVGIIIILPFTRNIIYNKIAKGKIATQAPGAFRNRGGKTEYKSETTLASDEVIDIEAEDV